MKFVFNVEKLKSHQIGLVRAHNLREGEKDRMSQLDQSAWFSKSERVEIVPWDQFRLNESRKLSKRKDAVEALSFVIQVGNQGDWREASTPDFPCGRARNPPPANPQEMATAVRKWAESEFGKENVVSLELHLDESTPHLHLIITPIFEQKLQAKKWLDGAKSVSALRASCHKSVNAVISCSYEPGRAGGEPHDQSKAAGGSRPENVASVVKTASGVLAALSGAIARENEQLIAENLMLKQENQRLKTVNAGLRTGGNGSRMIAAAEAEARLAAEARRVAVAEQAAEARAAAAEAQARATEQAAEARAAAAEAQARATEQAAEARVAAAEARVAAAEARVAAAEARVAEERRYAATRVVAAETNAARLAEQLNAALQKNADTEILQSKVKSLELDLSHSRLCEQESGEAAKNWMNEFISLRDAPKNTKEADMFHGF